MLKVILYIISSFIIASYSYANEWKTSVAENGMVEISTSTKSTIFGTEKVVFLQIFSAKYNKNDLKQLRECVGLNLEFRVLMK
jgi:hypothetical protein